MSPPGLTLGMNAVLCDLRERVEEASQVQLRVPAREDKLVPLQQARCAARHCSQQVYDQGREGRTALALTRKIC